MKNLIIKLYANNPVYSEDERVLDSENSDRNVYVAMSQTF